VYDDDDDDDDKLGLKLGKATWKHDAFTRTEQNLAVITFYKTLLIAKITFRNNYLLRKK
jgi:hypothetical protein